MGYLYRSMASQGHYVSYLADCFEEGPVLRDLVIVLDCANGAATPVAGDAFHRLVPAKLIEQNATPDGQNINVAAGSEHVRRDGRTLLEASRSDHAGLGSVFEGGA